MSPLVSWPIAFACARERLRAGPLWALTAMLALSGWAFADPAKGGAELFGGISFGEFILLLFTLFLGAGVISDELESGHAQLVLLRPITRAAWFGGRLCGAGLVLAAAMGLCWTLAWGAALAAGSGLQWTRLLVLPVGFAFAFSWLATLAALSVVARGWANTGWVVLSAIGWMLIYLGVRATSLIAQAARHEGGVAAKLVDFTRAVAPYLGPQDPTALVAQLQTGAPPDPGPLLWDLAWAAGAWLLGVWLLNQRELARRRP